MSEPFDSIKVALKKSFDVQIEVFSKLLEAQEHLRRAAATGLRNRSLDAARDLIEDMAKTIETNLS